MPNAAADSPRTTGNGAPGSMAGVVRVPKTAELVASQLRRRIVRGELTEGDALPREAELMEQFGVSRPTLREAFRVLESESLITVRRGARGGARVQVPDAGVAARYVGLILQYRATPLADVYEARTVIEPYCAGLLASRRTTADLELLWQHVEEAETVLSSDPDRFIRTHTDFHALIVDLAGNETLKILDRMLRQIVDLANWRRVPDDAHSPGGQRATHKGARAHRRLVELIVGRDSEAASALWKVHLLEADRYLLEGPTASTVLELLS